MSRISTEICNGDAAYVSIGICAQNIEQYFYTADFIVFITLNISKLRAKSQLAYCFNTAPHKVGEFLWTKTKTKRSRSFRGETRSPSLNPAAWTIHTPYCSIVKTRFFSSLWLLASNHRIPAALTRLPLCSCPVLFAPANSSQATPAKLTVWPSSEVTPIVAAAPSAAELLLALRAGSVEPIIPPPPPRSTTGLVLRRRGSERSD